MSAVAGYSVLQRGPRKIGRFLGFDGVQGGQYEALQDDRDDFRSEFAVEEHRRASERPREASEVGGGRPRVPAYLSG